MGREEVMESAQLNPSELESVVALEVKGKLSATTGTNTN